MAVSCGGDKQLHDPTPGLPADIDDSPREAARADRYCLVHGQRLEVPLKDGETS